MTKIFAIALLVPMLCGAFAAEATNEAAIGLARSYGLEKIKLHIPVKPGEKLRNIIIEKLTAMEKQRFIYLDLSISYMAQPESAQPFTIYFNGKPKVHEGCAIGELPMGAGVSYGLGALVDYNHLVMSVSTGGRHAYPYNDVACEYTDSGRVNQFHIRGFFHVIANSIPTAVSLQLRPLDPPLSVAMKVLGGNTDGRQ